LDATEDSNPESRNWFQGKSGSAGIIEWQWLVVTVTLEPAPKTTSVQAD
jgi:hypothetical protein